MGIPISGNLHITIVRSLIGAAGVVADQRPLRAPGPPAFGQDPKGQIPGSPGGTSSYGLPGHQYWGLFEGFP